MSAPRLNIGMGEFYVDGWTNIDVVSNEVVQPDMIADVTDLPFEDDSFGKAYMGHALEHLPEEAVPVALAEIRRVLRGGGALCLVGPDIELALGLRAMGRLSETMLEQIRHGEQRWDGDVHHWLPTNETVVAHARAAGFIRVVAIEPITGLRGTGWPVVAYDLWQHAVVATNPHPDAL